MAQRRAGPAAGRFEEHQSRASHATLLGLTVLEGLSHAGENTWEGGRIYDPDNGVDYSASMSIQDDSTLRVRAYVLLPLFGQTFIWTRVR